MAIPTENLIEKVTQVRGEHMFTVTLKNNKMLHVPIDGRNRDYHTVQSWISDPDNELIILEPEEMSYLDKRRAEYPSIDERLEDLYEANAFTPDMQRRIKAINDKYPAPE
jgi:hypothetical protein